MKLSLVRGAGLVARAVAVIREESGTHFERCLVSLFGEILPLEVKAKWDANEAGLNSRPGTARSAAPG